MSMFSNGAYVILALTFVLCMLCWLLPDSELMGGDEVQEDGGLPSSHELQALSEKLKLLDDHTVGIISSITGAPSTESFREGFPLLSVEDLKQMRGLFRRMGLDDYSVS